MQSLSDIRAIFAERGLRPKHRFGQNFLHDKNQIRKLVEAADLRAGDVVLEVGPGTGALSEALLERDVTLIACEIDRDMVSILRDRIGDRIVLIEGDCLESGRRLSAAIRDALAGRPFKLVANLPYQIASPLMACLLLDHPECAGEYVTIQREVGLRLLADPGTKEYGPLSIVVQALGDVRQISTLSPGCFWPRPQVTSMMVSITRRKELRTGSDDPAVFARFVTKLFTRRRKQLGTILGRDRAFWPEGVAAQQRPETLTVDQLVALWRACSR